MFGSFVAFINELSPIIKQTATTKLMTLISLTLFCIQSSFSQEIRYPNSNDSTIISIPEYFKSLGKVFSRDYVPNRIQLTEYKRGFKLTESDIIEVEKILQTNFPEKLKIRQNRNHWKNHWRQYLAYYNKENEKIVFIHLEKFIPKPSDSTLEWWTKYVSIVNEEWDKHNTDDFVVNLNNRTIALYGKSLEDFEK